MYDKLTLRPFEPEDALLEGDAIPVGPSTGVSIIYDNMLIGYGGITRIGRHNWTFFHLADGTGKRVMQEARVFLHRNCLRVYAAFDACGVEKIFAACESGRYPRAPYWLRAVGFREATEEERDDDIRATEQLIVGGLKAWIRYKR